MMALSAKDRAEPSPYAPSTFTYIDGDQIVTNSIKARSLDVTDLIASLATIDTAYIREANITGEISAAKLKAGTALAANITVNGTTINQVRLDAALGAREPAARVNEGSVQIDPGKIIVSGGTTLADWRKGGDETRIDGGALSANTVTANKLEIGSRNITLTGIQFEHNKPGANQVSWTAGAIRWVNDTGTITSTSIPAGSATWSSGVLFIFWVKGATTFSTTTSLATAMATNNVCLATYEGDFKLDADYGRTVIDGDMIKTGTITATHLVKTAALITETAQIKDLTVTALKIANNELYVPRFYARADVFLPLGSSRSNPSVLFDRTIPDFNGGGYIIAFNGYVDSSDNFDRFGQFQLLIDGVAQAEVGAGARTNSGGILAMIPVSLISSASGNGSTRIIVRG
ncbi:hypothetical protein H5395_16790 [Paracoccus sp. MC1854]|uniref:hypothetical protein n=1 Tax=Paracoccus sp. MC1854 TaxID=2760306 RepID=UPI00160477D3|nr:hypothetical protein [Paracoccus sp. MC1854]MBB1493131.1 hypothetical protein [Paracoccus sp. MC1854]